MRYISNFSCTSKEGFLFDKLKLNRDLMAGKCDYSFTKDAILAFS